MRALRATNYYATFQKPKDIRARSRPLLSIAKYTQSKLRGQSKVQPNWVIEAKKVRTVSDKNTTKMEGWWDETLYTDDHHTMSQAIHNCSLE